MRILVSGSTRTLAQLVQHASWRSRLGVMLSPKNHNSVRAVEAIGLPWGADNGCFRGFDRLLFRGFLNRLRGARRLRWIVCPDAVGDARATLSLWEEWYAEVRSAGPVAFVAQDGQETLRLPWRDIECLFLGGTTAWKLSRAAADLAQEARRQGKWLHMGRVNTLKRLRYAWDLGCASVDGSCYSRFADKFLLWSLRYLRRLEAQPQLWTL